MSNEELVAKIRNGEPERMGDLWSQVERLVKWKAARVFAALELRGCACGVEFDDLVQCGYPAMVAAVESYSPESGAFSAWLLYHLQSEFAEATGYRTKRGRNEPLNGALSLDKPLGEDGDGELFGDLIPDRRAAAELETVEDRLLHEQLKEVLADIMAKMPENYADILRRRFWQQQTLTQAGTEIGIAAESVRVNERKAMRYLREPCNKKRLEPFYDFNCYCGTGLSAFRSSGLSVQERYLAMQDRRGGRP